MGPRWWHGRCEPNGHRAGLPGCRAAGSGDHVLDCLVKRIGAVRIFFPSSTQGARPMNRNEVTEKIITAKVANGIQWADVAEKVGLSKEWVTAGCLGQMTFDAAQAQTVGEIFGLTAEERKWLQVVPYKGSLPTPVPTDPLIYRWYEIVSVYGTTIKELIHEEFGDGIMSAIDFSMDIQRTADPKGDRVNVILSGKFLPYKQY
jgi:cyanate lyase